MVKIGLATIWLDGCSGCHMSLLDIDERLIDLGGQVELLFSPLVDNKVFPDHVDITLVEGAVSNKNDIKKIVMVRKRSCSLVSFGDCAITANVPGMRNRFSVEEVLQRAYLENAETVRLESSNTRVAKGSVSFHSVPQLCQRARPVHEFVPVDFFLPGCPPPADAIFFFLSELLAGRTPDMSGRTRFGA